MIEQEPIQEDFTREELMFIHTALCNESVQVLFPPRDEYKLKLMTSVSRKIFEKLNFIENDNESSLDC